EAKTGTSIQVHFGVKSLTGCRVEPALNRDSKGRAIHLSSQWCVTYYRGQYLGPQSSLEVRNVVSVTVEVDMVRIRCCFDRNANRCRASGGQVVHEVEPASDDVAVAIDG